MCHTYQQLTVYYTCSERLTFLSIVVIEIIIVTVATTPPSPSPSGEGSLVPVPPTTTVSPVATKVTPTPWSVIGGGAITLDRLDL